LRNIGYVLATNNCKTRSCKNHGRCISLPNGFKCECKQGFSGKRCEDKHYCKLCHWL